MSPTLSLPNPCRYGPDDAHWSPWRKVAEQYDNPRPPRKLDLENRSLCGLSRNWGGDLKSFATVDKQGKIEVAGKHEPNPLLSLSVSPPATLAPSYLSGSEEYPKYAVCFNYL